MKRGKKPGSPKTGGRKKGSRNKRTIAIEKGAKGMLPLDFMLKVVRDPKENIELRCEMAKRLRRISMLAGRRKIRGAIPCQR